MSELRDKVRVQLKTANHAFYDRPDGTIMKDGPEGYWESQTDAAITAVIEALAAEAESRSDGIWLVDPVSYELDEWALPLPDWLRGHIGDTEATDE